MNYVTELRGYVFGESTGDETLSKLQNFAATETSGIDIQTKYVDMKYLKTNPGGELIYATFSEFLAINSYATTEGKSEGLFQLDPSNATEGLFGFPDNTSGTEIKNIAADFSPFGSFAKNLKLDEGLSSVKVVGACRFYFETTTEGITLYMPHESGKVGVAKFGRDGMYIDGTGKYQDDESSVPDNIKGFSGTDSAVFGAVKNLGNDCYFVDVPVIKPVDSMTDVDAGVKLKTVQTAAASSGSPGPGGTGGAPATPDVGGKTGGSTSGKKEIPFETVLSEDLQYYTSIKTLNVDSEEATSIDDMGLVYRIQGAEPTEMFEKNKTFFESKGYGTEFTTAFG